MSKIRIAGRLEESIVDGYGIRYVLFLQGCSHNCKGCQSPETHDFSRGVEADTDSILEEICNDTLLDGITLSGGDPFFQARNLIEFCKKIKENNLSIWAYTGFTYEALINRKDEMTELLNYIDVLVDGPFILEQKSLSAMFRGSSNQRLIDVQQSLKENKIVIYSEV